MATESVHDILDSLSTREVGAERELTGTITRVFYSSDRFTSGALKADDGPMLARDCRFALSGKASLNDKVTLLGKWVDDPKWGKQFQASGVRYPMPETVGTDVAHGLAAYLAREPAFKGLGPIKARLLADAFGDTWDTVIREDLSRVCEVGKITREMAENIQRVWTLRADTNAISSWLAGHGLTAKQIQRIAERYGNRAHAVLTENPYLLIDDLDGFGFLKADQIALKMGVDKLHPGRLRACITHILTERAYQDGHTCTLRAELTDAALKNLYLDNLNARALIGEHIDALCASGELHAEGAYIGIAKIAQEERDIWNWLARYGEEPAICDTRTPTDDERSRWTSNLSNPLEEAQAQAVDNALRYRCTIITGGAGTGKSYTIRTIRDIYRSQLGAEVAVCAPTGKAARRLANDGVPATTIHRLLEYDPITHGFHYNRDCKLPYTLIIVDEVSMCAIPLLHDLLQAVMWETSTVVLVGDANQLPPIGPGNTLRDAIAGKLCPVTRLTVCHRNQGQLKANCGKILEGQVVRTTSKANPDAPFPEWFVCTALEDPEYLVDQVRVLQAEQFAAWGFDPITDCQVIAPQRKGPIGVNRLNLEMQRVWQRVKYGRDLPAITSFEQRAAYYPGDKVMQIQNDHKRGIMNGTQGIIKSEKRETDENGRSVTVYWIEFEDGDGTIVSEVTKDSEEYNQLSLAYACTVHKVQGSQWPCIVSIVHRSHAYMLSRNLLYTACTRARLSSIILGEPVGIRRAVNTITPMDRITWTRVMTQGQGRNDKEEARQ